MVTADWLLNAMPQSRHLKLQISFSRQVRPPRMEASLPGRDEDASHPVILYNAPHGRHPLPLPWIGGVVVLN